MRAAKAADGAGSKKLFRIKLLVLGDSACGKSALVTRWVDGRGPSRYSQTVGVEHTVKRHVLGPQGEFDLRINMWELSGADVFLDVRTEFYKDGQAVILCFDPSNPTSFQSLPKWLNEIKEHGAGTQLPTILVATKSDQATSRKVSEHEAREWAQQQGFLYSECSALTGQGVGASFDMIIARTLSCLPNIPPELLAAAMKAVPPSSSSQGPSPHPPTMPRVPSANGMRESFRRGSLDIDRDRDSSGSLILVADAEELKRIERAVNDFDVLKLDRSATLAQVKSSYRKLAVAVHPDKCKLNEAQAAFQKINNAYQSIVSKLGG